MDNVTHLTTEQRQDAGIPTDLNVYSNPSDTTPPGLLGMRFSPAVVNTSLSDQSVSIQLDLKDDWAGVDLSLWPGYSYIGAVRFVSNVLPRKGSVRAASRLAFDRLPAVCSLDRSPSQLTTLAKSGIIAWNAAWTTYALCLICLTPCIKMRSCGSHAIPAAEGCS